VSDSRFNIVTRPQLLPPACSVIDRRDDHEWFLDCGWFEDYYGTIYFGSRDFDEMARTAGYVPLTEVQKYKDRIKELQRDLRNTESELSNLRALRDALNANVLQPTVVSTAE
jgi:hypothetical protein